jgi:hypothetical protein
MNTTIELAQLVAWHQYFSTHPHPTPKVKEIAESLEKHLHTILTNLQGIPAPAKGS